MNRGIGRRRFKEPKLRLKPSLTDRVTVTIIGTLNVIFLILFFFMVGYIVLSSFVVRDSSAPLGIKISLDGFQAIFENDKVKRGFLNSVVYTTVGVAASTVVTVALAFALSRPEFRMAKRIYNVFAYSSCFGAGLVPLYLIVKNLGLLNSMWSLILPGIVSVYNVFLLQSYFRNNIPSEIIDAAKIDGCGYFRCLQFIAVPMALSFIGLIAFFYAVSYWGAYFNASIFITESSKLPLQNVLREMLITNRELLATQGGTLTDSGITLVQQSRLFEYALIVFSTTPMIILLALIRKNLKNLGAEQGKVI